MRFRAEMNSVTGTQPVSHAEVDPDAQRAFRIYRDWNGMYRWTLTDQSGHRLLASQFSSAALAGALREVQALRAQRSFAGTVIYDETGR